jgi:transposase-like protein
MKLTHIIASATTAAVLGTLGVSIAGATSTQVDSPTTTAAADDTARRPGVRLLAGAFATAAESIGITPRELRDELRDDASIAAIASAHGVDPQTVVDALVTAGSEKIEAARAAGRLSDERAAKLTDALPDRAEQFVRKEREVRDPRRPRPARGLELAATTIGIDRADLVTELRAGKTIADVATERGVEPQTVVDALAEAADERIADRADERLAAQQERARLRVEKFVGEWSPQA